MIRIAQLTDIHVPDFSDLRRRDVFNKRITGYVNHRLGRHQRHDAAQLDAAVSRLLVERPDLIVISGDISNVGLQSEWQAAIRRLKPLADAGLRIGVVPGNHDYYLRQNPGQFESTFAAWQFADSRVGGFYPFVLRAGRVSVLMLNSAVPTAPLMAWGRIELDQLERARQLTDIEQDQGQTVVAVIHHHPVPAPHKKVEATRNLRNAWYLRRFLVDANIRVLMHGHNHYLQLTRLGQASGPLVVGLPSTTYTRSEPEPVHACLAMYEFDGSDPQLLLAPIDRQSMTFGAWQRTDLSSAAIFPMT
jgi:3',5'-cyclic AMP phosphodiesterase CpdA